MFLHVPTSPLHSFALPPQRSVLQVPYPLYTSSIALNVAQLRSVYKAWYNQHHAQNASLLYKRTKFIHQLPGFVLKINYTEVITLPVSWATQRFVVKEDDSPLGHDTVTVCILGHTEIRG
jgi:chloramphenicol O-acetyltransferase